MEDIAQTGAHLKRRRDLDVIGILVVLGLVFFHTSQIFSPFGLFIKNAPPSLEELSQLAATVFIFFVTLWGMPLMFLVAGMAVWFSLYKRTAAEFARERIQRLFIPFLLGFLIFTPLNQYIILKQQSPADTSTYWQFLRVFFDLEFDLASPLFIKGTSDYFSLAHMWFLIYLLGYSLLLLPLFLYLRRPIGRRLLERVVPFFTRPLAIYLLALPLAAIQVVLGTPNAAVAATWNLWAYILFLTYGFLFAADIRFEQAVQQHRKSALVLGMLGFLVYLGGFLVLSGVISVGIRIDYRVGYILLRFVQGITGWCWIVAIIGLVGASHRKRPKSPGTELRPQSSGLSLLNDQPSLKERVIAYIGEAQLPFYVLHMTAVVVVGRLVVEWEVNALGKYLVIVLFSLIITFLIYDIGVRRTRLTRFLFGLKPEAISEEQLPMKAPLKGALYELYEPERPGT